MPDVVHASTATWTTNRTLVKPGFTGLLASEWTKLRSVRTNWIMACLAIVLSTGFAGVTVFAVGATIEDQSAPPDPLLHLNFGLLLGVIPLKVLGVLAATSEYSSEMIRSTFIVTPQRLRVLAAKALVIGAVGLATTTLMIVGMYLATQFVRRSYALETISISEGDTQRFLAAYAAGGVVYVIVPFALGLLLRSTAGTVTIAIGMFFLPGMIGAAMPLWIQENVFRFLPETALDNLSGSIASDSAVYLGSGSAFLVITAWIVTLFLIAGIALNRRDA
jgi:ABC-2 type transport system permease protein